MFCIAKTIVLYLALVLLDICSMDSINGHDILKTLNDITKAGGTFTIAFFKYSRAKKQASGKLQTLAGCRTRLQLPHDKFEIDGANYFLFTDADGNPKTCYKILIRFIGLPSDNFVLKQVKWFNDNDNDNN